jgi:peptidoglycan/xylan/chitin deacetylase (PgdA/CDA1 family)
MLGEMFDGATLAELGARGHEIGAHSHSHLDCARTPAPEVERDVAKNLIVLSEAGWNAAVSAFAYPFGETTYAVKRWVGELFATGRGILPGVNAGEADRSQLRAVELGASAASRRRAFAMLESCIQTSGWLIFFTHDVNASPSPYGAPAALIEELALRAADGGAVLAPPTLAAALSGVID